MRDIYYWSILPEGPKATTAKGAEGRFAMDPYSPGDRAIQYQKSEG
jgi:hypothetical protein